MADQANKLEAQSRALEKEAQALQDQETGGCNGPKAVDAAGCNKKLAEAKDAWKRGQEFASQAKQHFATAADVNKDIPTYVGAAQAAAARAAYDANPAWQPPPPPNR